MTGTSRPLIVIAGLASLAWPVAGFGVDIDIRASAATIYTDNVSLAPSGEEDGEFVLRADPGIAISSIGSRYDFSLDYTLETYYFLDQEDSSVFHQGEAMLDLTLIPEHFLLKSSAMIDQVISDPSGPVSFGNLPITGNRTDAVRLETAPEWHQDIFGSEFVASYRLGRLDYDDDNLQDLDYRFADARLTSPEVERGLGWGARYEHHTYTYDLPPDLKRQLVELSLSWTLGGGWTPFGAFGWESDVRDRTDASLTETLWRAGLRRQTAVTRLEAFAGERSFGSWYGALLELRGRSEPRNLIRLSYDETPTVDEGFDAIRSFRDLDDLITPPGTPPIVDPTLPPGTVGPGVRQIYVRKAARLLLSRATGRTELSFIAFHENNEDITSVDQPDVTRESEETGAALRVAYQAGSRTRLTGDLLWSTRDFDTTSATNSDDRLFQIRAAALYALGQRTSLEFWIAREEQNGSASNDYKEHQIGLSIGRTF